MSSQENQRGSEIHKSLINYHRNNVKFLHSRLHETHNGLEAEKICIFSESLKTLSLWVTF